MAVEFINPQSGLEQPAKHLVAIVPNDSNDLLQHVRAIYVGVGGDIELTAIGDDTPQILLAVPQGTVVPVMTKRVLATNTTATDLIGYW